MLLRFCRSCRYLDMLKMCLLWNKLLITLSDCFQPESAGVDADIQREYARQREHLERSVASLRKKLTKDSEIHRADNVRIMQVTNAKQSMIAIVVVDDDYDDFVDVGGFVDDDSDCVDDDDDVVAGVVVDLIICLFIYHIQYVCFLVFLLYVLDA